MGIALLVALHDPKASVATVHAATFEAMVPHLPAPLTHTLTSEGTPIPKALAALLPHKHWHMPRLDIGVSPDSVGHVTPVHGSKKRFV